MLTISASFSNFWHLLVNWFKWSGWV